jgi:hypothetical protein
MEDHIQIMKRKRCWKCFSLRDKDIRGKQKLYTCCIHLELLKAIPLQALAGPEVSRRLRLLDFKKIGT